MLSLNEYQLKFKNTVTRKIENEDELAENIETLSLRETLRFTKEMRIEVYRYAYLARLQESLTSDFPRVIQAIGEEAWDHLSESYLRICPPTQNSLLDLGADLASYIRTSTELGEDIAELAEIDFIALLSYIQNASTPLPTFENPDDFLLKLQLQESVRFWKPSHPLSKRKPALLVHLPSGVQFLELAEKEMQILMTLRKPATLEELLEIVQQTLHTEEEVFQFFKYFSTNGVFQLA